MFNKVLAWWKGLKWYWQIFGILAVIAVGAVAVCVFVGTGGKHGIKTQKQLQALDDLHKKQVDATLKKQEAKVTALEKEIKKHDADVQAGVTELKAIGEQAVELDNSLTEKTKPSVADIDKWRDEHGV